MQRAAPCPQSLIDQGVSSGISAVLQPRLGPDRRSKHGKAAGKVQVQMRKLVLVQGAVVEVRSTLLQQRRSSQIETARA